jgi:hypothetical protein
MNLKTTGSGQIILATRIAIWLGEYEQMKMAAIRANLTLAEWLGAAGREKLERDGAGE